MPESDVVLEIKGLDKHYGRIHAVNSLSLQVRRGMVFGMLGPNGSGKTTTLGMVLGVTSPDRGEINWFNKGNHHHIRKSIGAILERPVFYPYMTARQNLELVCRIKEVPYQRIPNVLEITGLSDRANDPFKSYSLGMKQRLAIASALLCDPLVMILDEPTNGLDPQGIADIRELILKIAESGKTIVLASHLLDEVQKVCTDYCVLSKGRLLYNGSVSSDLGVKSMFDVAAGDMNALRNKLLSLKDISVIEDSDQLIRVQLHQGIGPATLNELLAREGIFLHHLVAGKKSLEEEFLKILREDQS